MCSYSFFLYIISRCKPISNCIMKKFIRYFRSVHLHFWVHNPEEEHSKVNDLVENHSAQFWLLCSSQVHHPKTTFMLAFEAKTEAENNAPTQVKNISQFQLSFYDNGIFTFNNRPVLRQIFVKKSYISFHWSMAYVFNKYCSLTRSKTPCTWLIGSFTFSTRTCNIEISSLNNQWEQKFFSFTLILVLRGVFKENCR